MRAPIRDKMCIRVEVTGKTGERIVGLSPNVFITDPCALCTAVCLVWSGSVHVDATSRALERYMFL